jgi:hypothetical protein
VKSLKVGVCAGVCCPVICGVWYASKKCDDGSHFGVWKGAWCIAADFGVDDGLGNCQSGNLQEKFDQ